MFRIKIFISIIIFSFLLVGTSIIKNETRELEKKIINISKIINIKEKDFNESQLDYFYLTSPSMIEQRIKHLDHIEYIPMEYSKIFLSLSSFQDLDHKIAIQDYNNDQKTKKK